MSAPCLHTLAGWCCQGPECMLASDGPWSLIYTSWPSLPVLLCTHWPWEQMMARQTAAVLPVLHVKYAPSANSTAPRQCMVSKLQHAKLTALDRHLPSAYALNKVRKS